MGQSKQIVQMLPKIIWGTITLYDKKLLEHTTICHGVYHRLALWRELMKVVSIYIVLSAPHNGTKSYINSKWHSLLSTIFSITYDVNGLAR